MSKSRSGKQNCAGRRQASRRSRILIAGLVLGLLVCGGLLARQRSLSSAAKRNIAPGAQIVPASLSPASPSKEYIYAGGKLVATEEPGSQAPHQHGVGLYDASRGYWFLLNENRTGGAGEPLFSFGPGGNIGWLPIAGDWDGNGSHSVGLYDASRGYWFLLNENKTGGSGEPLFSFGPGGNLGWLPVAGDWDGDGKDSVGLYDASRGYWFLLNENRTGGAGEPLFSFGPGGSLGWLPIAGDWDADGKDGVGLYDASRGYWFLLNENKTGGAGVPLFSFGPGGNLGWLPIAGDWDNR